MKTLELRPKGPKYTVPTPTGEMVTLEEPPWRKLVLQVIDAPPLDVQGQPMGFTPDLMRKRIRLSTVLEKLPEDATELELEDADTTELVTALSHVRWNRVSQWMLDFSDAVIAMPNGKKKD